MCDLETTKILVNEDEAKIHWGAIDAREKKKSLYNIIKMPVSVNARSRTSVCDRSLAETAGSNPARGMHVSFCECCVMSGRGLCVMLAEQSRRGRVFKLQTTKKSKVKVAP